MASLNKKRKPSVLRRIDIPKNTLNEINKLMHKTKKTIPEIINNAIESYNQIICSFDDFNDTQIISAKLKIYKTDYNYLISLGDEFIKKFSIMIHCYYINVMKDTNEIKINSNNGKSESYKKPEVISFKLDKQIATILESYAIRSGKTKSEIIRDALKQYLQIKEKIFETKRIKIYT